jgi:transcription antitermination factor NusA-like protein
MTADQLATAINMGGVLVKNTEMITKTPAEIMNIADRKDHYQRAKMQTFAILTKIFPFSGDDKGKIIYQSALPGLFCLRCRYY